MRYKIIEYDVYGTVFKNIIVELEDNSFKSFPIDEKNSEYVDFQKHIADYVLEDFN